jgi:hypothetical protein
LGHHHSLLRAVIGCRNVDGLGTSGKQGVAHGLCRLKPLIRVAKHRLFDQMER